MKFLLLFPALAVCSFAASTEPVHTVDPAITSGGFSITLVNGDDVNAGLVPHQCTLKSAAVGVVELTANGSDNAVDIPLDEMQQSAGYRFDTATYKLLRLRVLAGTSVSGGFTVLWRTLDGGRYTSGRITVPHTPGKWAVHSLDFTAVPGWTGELVNLRFQMLSDPADNGKSVLIDRIELAADDSADTTFGLDPVLLNVIQRVKTKDGGYRSEWEDIAKYNAKEKPGNASMFDGRVYYFAKDPGKDRLAIYRYHNNQSGDDMDSATAPPLGYQREDLLGHVWTRPFPGMSPVLRFKSLSGRNGLFDPTEKPAGYTGDAVLGYAYARSESPLQEYETECDKMDDIFYIQSGKVRFGVNLDHGAAGWHWFHGDKQMVNISDFGRQMQLSYYFNGMNPSEVGFGRGQVGDPVIHVHRIGNTLVTRTVPIDWNFKNVTRMTGSISHPDLLPGITLGKDVTFGILGHPHVAKWTAYLHTPLAIGTSGGGSQLEIISNHPTADFVNRSNVQFDAKGKLVITATRDKPDKSSDETGPLYNYPKSGIGGNISAVGPGADALAFGLLVGTNGKGAKGTSGYRYTFAGEERVGSSRHVNISATDGIGSAHASPFDGRTTAQRSVMRTPTAAGDNRYTVYIMSGSVSEVQSYMQDLYDHRETLEW